MRKCIVTLLAASAMAFSSTAASAQEVLVIAGQEILGMPIPTGFKIGSSGPGTMDLIPSGEKIQNWTTIFSFVVMRHLDVDMAYVRSFNQQRFFTTCVPEHPLPVNKPDRMEYGYRIAEWTQACPMTISGPSNGHPEIDMVKFIQGKSVDAFVMVGFRFAPSPELVQEWQATLDEVFLRTKES